MIQVNISFIIHIIFLSHGYFFLKYFFDYMYDSIILFNENEKAYRVKIEEEKNNVIKEREKGEKIYDLAKKRFLKKLSCNISLIKKKNEYSPIKEEKIESFSLSSEKEETIRKTYQEKIDEMLGV